MFIAGIDEAGYGPLLGPFTAGWSLFRVPSTDTNLWEVTSDCVAQKPGRKDRRLRIDDSKRVNTGPHGRTRLERAVAPSSVWSQNSASIFALGSKRPPLETGVGSAWRPGLVHCLALPALLPMWSALI